MRTHSLNLSQLSTQQRGARLLVLALLLCSACSGDEIPADDGSDGGVRTVSGSDQRNDVDSVGITRPRTKSDKPQSFESELTGTGSSGDPSDERESAPTAGGNADAVNVSDSDSKSAERAIVEADIVQVSGNTLYALSRHAGLSVIDIASPARLRLLGTYRELTGTPFEMYLRDSVAIVMFSSWGQYEKQSDDTYLWIQTSKVVALDTSDPAAIHAIGSFDVAGEVSDSRLVGDIMYVVGYQNGYCWDCKENTPLTEVLSLDLTDPRAIKRVDSLQLMAQPGSYGGGKRSISVTSQRIYVAGPEYGQTQPTGSTIQVVDISNAGGALIEGATVAVQGQITSRWQIDEYQNVLRVVSQPWQWRANGATPPSVQTFTVSSSQEIKPLGRTNLTIPPNETLRSVRFDGPRGYAITARNTDPLFTIDLSNPAQPRQRGELVMPGWVYHMEPRGERLIGLGYDQNNPAGSITVSIFDVSDLATPRMLSRVNFGGTWAYLPEDQDRIHKAFKVLDAQGLILVPFSGWSDTTRGEQYCSGRYRSGIQLVDFKNDTLTARGVAPSRGEARRAILHGDSLLAVSDEAVDAFDITNRATPAVQGRLTIAQNVLSALPLANGHVARITQDWYGQQRSTLDIVALADVDRADQRVGELNLSELLSSGTPCSGNAYVEQAFVSGNEIDLLIHHWQYDGASYTQKSGVVVIDASDPSAPSVLSKLEWTQSSRGEESSWYRFSSYYDYGFIGNHESVVRTDQALVLQEQRWARTTFGSQNTFEARLQVIDLSDPAHPKRTTVSLDDAAGYGGLVPDGADVLFSHYDELQDKAHARFFVNRLDLSDPSEPKLTDKISVPGALLHYDREHGRAVTSELTRRVVENVTNSTCWERFGYAEWQPNGSADGGYVPYNENTKGTCTAYLQHLHLVRFVTGGAVLDSSYHLAESERISASSMGDARVTAVLSQGYGGGWGYAEVDCFDCGGRGYYGGSPGKPAEILVLGGLESGLFEAGRLTVDNTESSWWGFYGSPPVYATGTKALVQSSNDVAIIDTSEASAPKLIRTVPLFGGYANDLQAAGDLVLLSLGMNGVQRIDL